VAEDLSKNNSNSNSSLQLNAIPESPHKAVTSSKVQFGRIIPPQQQILIYSSEEWEEFIREWVHSQKAKYSQVLRCAGPNDMGVDVAGFTDSKGLYGIWDNFQCKHYSKALSPSIASVEIAKILWYSFNKQFVVPRKYYFIAPRGCGPDLTKLLSDSAALCDYVIKNWTKQCSDKITQKQTITLVGAFKSYVKTFNFSIFSYRTSLEIIDEHRSTPYYATRFGGGLPDRPMVLPPPAEVDINESKYVQQLFDAYSDHAKQEISKIDHLTTHQYLADHFHRQREFFYHAEALRNFARDTVPPGTFEDLQSEVHAAVIDVEAENHEDSYARVNAVINTAAVLPLTSNALISVIKTQDKKGICHQLANDDRLDWRKP
jgi:hypothetical protein